MNRRKFLDTLGTGIIATPLHSAFAQSSTPLPCGHDGFPHMFPLTSDHNAVDGRPCFSPDGRTVLFMRQYIEGQHPDGQPIYGATDFLTIPADGGEAKLLLHVEGMQLTRPDWSWVRNHFQIAFDGIIDGENSIYLLDYPSRKFVRILRGNTAANRIFSYPCWYPGGHMLCVTNYWENVNANGFGSPNSHQHLLRCDLSGRTEPLTRPRAIWPGMSSVAHAGFPRGSLPPIAFAGEVPNSQGYNQDSNQIWIRRPNGTVFAIDGQQARAPWWSPDGKSIAFESNRLTGSKYQIFVQNPANPSEIRALTCPEYGVQHAKWSPDGSRIVFAYGIPDSNGAQGIAYVDLNAS